MIRKTPVACLLSAILSGTAFAGPVAEFETTYSDVYASYRTALFATNSGDATKSQNALQTFEDKWAALLSVYSSNPPPQYADDPLWGTTLADVTGQLEDAQTRTDEGKLPDAHEALEAVRDTLGALHARNGIETFSDRMNAYHAEMEHVLSIDLTDIDPAKQQVLLERAAVLSYLAEDVLRSPPIGVDATNTDYATLAGAFDTSVGQFMAAARSGDAEALRAAINGLKVPYSKFFLNFG